MTHQQSRPLQVLMVEDNPADVDLILEALEDSPLWLNVEVVTDGSAAIDYLKRRGPFLGTQLPDFVVLDLNLPKRSGFEVLTEMRSDEPLRDLPVMILTSSEAGQDIAKSYRLGANFYMTKPADFSEVRAIVAALERILLGLARVALMAPPEKTGGCV